MAALGSLRASVVKASPVEDHSTYQYHIRLQCDGASWEVTKRFSDFDTLLQSLSGARYAGLPKLPAKTLLGSPTDQAAIDARKEQLRILLHDLLSRPDARTSPHLRQFLELESHMEAAPRPLQPEPVRTFEDARFGVSGLCAGPRANLLLVTHEDSTHLSRLGRVWSVVEPDELGALHMWSQANDGTWKRIYSHTYGIKARSLCWEDTTRQFFVGLEDGRIEVYGVSAETLQPSKKAVLELHHKSPVTHICASPRRVLSLGFDTAMRVIDVTSRELLCGGRLLKRLRNETDYLSTGWLDDEKDLALIGTSGGDLFVFDISSNPPIFLNSVELGTKPVSTILESKETLVAIGDCVVVLNYEGKGSERRFVKLGTHRAKYLQEDEVSILSLAAAPERQLLFGGYSDGSVAIWSNRESEAAVVVRAHQCDVVRLVWLESDPWGPVLFSGGGDGKVTMWNLTARHEDFALAAAPDALAETLAAESLTGAPTSLGDALASDFEPSWGGNSDMFRVEHPRVNPQALRREDESDSEDDITDAFR